MTLGPVGLIFALWAGALLGPGPRRTTVGGQPYLRVRVQALSAQQASTSVLHPLTWPLVRLPSQPRGGLGAQGHPGPWGPMVTLGPPGIPWRPRDASLEVLEKPISRSPPAGPFWLLPEALEASRSL